MCEKFAAEVGLIFSTDPTPSKTKTKCLFMSGKKCNKTKPAPLLLDGKQLPWVPRATHLGHEICETGEMESDAAAKRGKFIQDSVNVRETFSFASPVEVLRATKIYCCAIYGSMLWRLDGLAAGQVFRAWNTCVKLAWGVPRATHTYFVDQLLSCGMTSLKTDILCRYSKFISSLKNSPSVEVSVVANIALRDVRSNTGANVRFLTTESGLDPSEGTAAIKRALCDQLCQPEEIDKWRIKYLATLLCDRGEFHYDGMETEENYITGLIDSLCIN